MIDKRQVKRNNKSQENIQLITIRYDITVCQVLHSLVQNIFFRVTWINKVYGIVRVVIYIYIYPSIHPLTHYEHFIHISSCIFYTSQ